MILFVILSFQLCTAKTESNEASNLRKEVIAPPESIVQKYELNPFYKKYIDVNGIAITSSEKVVDEALYEVGYLIHNALMNRPDILKAMAEGGTRIIVIGAKEEVSDIPEYYKSDPDEAARQNRRVRGYGGMRLTSCG